MITGVRDIFYMLFLVCLLMAESARAQTSDTINGGRLNDDSAVVIALADDAGKMKAPKKKKDWNTWRPDPKRALWLALVIPGAGQIYNRKYWKLPIFYGGFVGCIYALSWNGQMYHDYSQAYLDIMDDDPATQSYNNFLHLGTRVTPQNEERFKTIFKSRKDRFRRWRDLSVFAMIGVYALSVIDAYVDASLSDFDISRDLSLHVQPAVIGSGGGSQAGLWNNKRNNALGVQCCISF